MNQRIRELESTARSWAKDEIAYLERVHNRDYTFDEASNEFNKKFAELIVVECASICEINGASYKHSFAPSKAKLAGSTSVYCGALIKKHFGVES